MFKAERWFCVRMNTLNSKSIRARGTKFSDNMCYYCRQLNKVKELVQTPLHISKLNKTYKKRDFKTCSQCCACLSSNKLIKWLNCSQNKLFNMHLLGTSNNRPLKATPKSKTSSSSPSSSSLSTWDDIRTAITSIWVTLVPTRKAKLFTLLKPNSILHRKGHKATRGNNNSRGRITAITTISKARQALES